MLQTVQGKEKLQEHSGLQLQQTLATRLDGLQVYIMQWICLMGTLLF
jgi:hypothetical protein